MPRLLDLTGPLHYPVADDLGLAGAQKAAQERHRNPPLVRLGGPTIRRPDAKSLFLFALVVNPQSTLSALREMYESRLGNLTDVERQ